MGRLVGWWVGSLQEGRVTWGIWTICGSNFPFSPKKFFKNFRELTEACSVAAGFCTSSTRSRTSKIGGHKCNAHLLQTQFLLLDLSWSDCGLLEDGADSLACSHCIMQHLWGRKDAWLHVCLLRR